MEAVKEWLTFATLVLGFAVGLSAFTPKGYRGLQLLLVFMLRPELKKLETKITEQAEGIETMILEHIDEEFLLAHRRSST